MTSSDSNKSPHALPPLPVHSEMQKKKKSFFDTLIQHLRTRFATRTLVDEPVTGKMQSRPPLLDLPPRADDPAALTTEEQNDWEHIKRVTTSPASGASQKPRENSPASSLRLPGEDPEFRKREEFHRMLAIQESPTSGALTPEGMALNNAVHGIGAIAVTALENKGRSPHHRSA